MQIKFSAALLVAILLLFLMTATGCTKTTPTSDFSTKDGAEKMLTRVAYNYNGGSVNGSDFFIAVTPEIIESTRFYDFETNEYKTKTDVPLTDDQWTKIQEAVLVIADVLNEKPQSTSLIEEVIGDIDFGAVDGSSDSSFYLTWKSSEDEWNTEYDTPADRRFSTLVSLLQETANPTGREIVYYDEPVLTGMYIKQDAVLEKNYFLYECTVKDTQNGERYYNATFYDNGKVSYSTIVYEDTWSQILEKCQSLNLEALDEGSSSKKAVCRFYYSDERQISVNPNRKVMAEMKEFFQALTAELQAAELQD